MAPALWTPGQKISITGPRVIVRALEETDLGDDLEKWTGSESRTAFIWKPEIAKRDYMSGLIRFCDNRETFVWGIWSIELLCMVGYYKVQIVQEDHGRGSERTAIQTIVVGDAWAGHGFGQEGGDLANWFLIRFAGVTAVGPRIYEENEKTWRLAERVGYHLSRTSEERTKSGTSRTVRHYVVFAEEIEEKRAELYAQVRLEVLE